MLNRSGVSGISGRLGFDSPDIVIGAADAADADVSAGVNERGTVRVIADARLTNAAEIRAQLTTRGHQFQGATDSELIAHAYEEWGPQGVARLRGAFACAVWDAEARRLVLARDQSVSAACITRCSPTAASPSRQRFTRCSTSTASGASGRRKGSTPTSRSATYPHR